MYRDNNNNTDPFCYGRIDPETIIPVYPPGPSWPFPHDHEPSNIMIPGNDWGISRIEDKKYY